MKGDYANHSVGLRLHLVLSNIPLFNREFAWHANFVDSVQSSMGIGLSLREQLNAAAGKRGLRVHYPELALCTDNGAMIALAGALRLQDDPARAQRNYAFDVKPRWPLAQA